MIWLLLFYVNSGNKEKREGKSSVNGPFSIYDDEENAKRASFAFVIKLVSIQEYVWMSALAMI